MLCSLHRQFAIPWLYVGDFNKLLKSLEKLRGLLRPYGQMERFREAFDECGLLDLGFVSNKFNWTKNYPNGGIVWERLDRAVSTAEWFNCFLVTKVHTLACTSSDHLSPFCSKVLLKRLKDLDDLSSCGLKIMVVMT